jgi:hypothetical protein
MGRIRITWIAANTVDSEALPTVFADRHDHYLYGRSIDDAGLGLDHGLDLMDSLWI